MQVILTHGNQDRLFLCSINIFDNSSIQQFLPCFRVLLVLAQRFNPVDMTLVEQNRLTLLIDNKQWSTDSTGIGKQSKFTFSNISDDTNLVLELTTASHLK
jgi:hypothetical protein